MPRAKKGKRSRAGEGQAEARPKRARAEHAEDAADKPTELVEAPDCEDKEEEEEEEEEEVIVRPAGAGAVGTAEAGEESESEAPSGDEGGVDSLEAPVAEIGDQRLPDCFRTVFEGSHGQLSKPSVIQQRLWPLVLGGRDVLAIAPTGSGKTLAYLLPAAAHVLEAKAKRKGRATPRAPQVLVLVPTRELALQVTGVASRLHRLLGVSSVAVYGGRDRADQVDLLATEHGVSVVIGTPGRVQDLLGAGDLRVDETSMFILDECDRMLDLGFEPQIRAIVEQLSDTQNVLLSATFPQKVRAAAKRLRLVRRSPATVLVEAGAEQGTAIAGLPRVRDAATAGDGTEGERSLTSASFAASISPSITQIVHVCAEHKKPKKLIKFIEKVRAEDKTEGRRNQSSILVFCTRIKTVKFVDTFLRERNSIANCAALHGGLQQAVRERVLRNFKAGKLRILVATDVAGRGIDIKGLPYVVNYDFPSTLKMYAHRIGRTGRNDRPGTAFSFFTRGLKPLAKDLIELLELCKQPVDSYLRQLLDDGTGGAGPSAPKKRRDKKKKRQPKEASDTASA